MTPREYERLLPHEKEVLDNEYFRERRIQDKLKEIIQEKVTEKSKAEIEILNIIALKLKEKGYTAIDVENSDDLPEVKKLIWNTIRENKNIVLRIPYYRLKELFGDDFK